MNFITKEVPPGTQDGIEPYHHKSTMNVRIERNWLP